MTEAERLAEVITRFLPNVHAGTLRVFGDWFGKPHDNFHRVVDAHAREDTLTVKFDEGEELTVVGPSDAVVSETEFRIARANLVRWEWFYYGRPKVPENRYFEEHRVDGQRVEGSSNADWYDPEFQPSVHLPAVELV